MILLEKGEKSEPTAFVELIGPSLGGQQAFEHQIWLFLHSESDGASVFPSKKLIIPRFPKTPQETKDVVNIRMRMMHIQ